MRITRSGAGRLWSRRAAGFLLHTFLSPPKEKCERPTGQPVPIRAGVGASSPAKGNFLRQSCLLLMQCRVAFRSPPCTPFGSPSEAIERPIGLQVLPPRRNRRVKPHRGAGNAPAGAPKGFPRGKQSARFALPCVPLVVCLNSGSLTAFGGCIHWMTVNFSNLI